MACLQDTIGFVVRVAAAAAVMGICAPSGMSVYAETMAESFEIGATFGDRDAFDIRVGGSGCIIASVEAWSPAATGDSKAPQLALILNGDGNDQAYARVDGAPGRAPLWLSFAVSEDEARRVGTWTVSVVNFSRAGSAKGAVRIEYPPAQVPCEFKAIARNGRVNLSWTYAGEPFDGYFVVERRDGAAWSAVPDCAQDAAASSRFSCRDEQVRRGATYVYRVCATSGNQCHSSGVLPPRAVTVR